MKTLSLSDAEHTGVELMLHAIHCPGDDYGLRGDNLQKVATDIIRGPSDLAFAGRARAHLRTLDYVLENSDLPREIAVVGRARRTLAAMVEVAESRQTIRA